MLNDRFRRSLLGGRILMTLGVAALPESTAAAILDKVRRFDSFTADNDPHDEHDFGTIEHDGSRVFWKIEYYDRALAAGSPDPADPSITIRMLTLMLAEEY